MPVKLRLRRQGRKGIPYFHIVAADSRSARDGKFLEKVGIYDPSRVPANIEINHERAISWLKNGAQPTDTVRAILRYTGVNLKFALMKQGKSPEEVERIFNKWWEERTARVNKKIDSLHESKKDKAKADFEREAKVREAKEAKIAARQKAALEATNPPAEETAPAAEEAAPAAEESAPPTE